MLQARFKHQQHLLQARFAACVARLRRAGGPHELLRRRTDVPRPDRLHNPHPELLAVGAPAAYFLACATLDKHSSGSISHVGGSHTS